MRNSALNLLFTAAALLATLATRFVRDKARKSGKKRPDTFAPHLRPLKIVVLNPLTGSDYNKLLMTMLEELFAAAGVLVNLVEIDVYPSTARFPNWDAFDGVIIPGCAASAYDKELWIQRLFGAIRELDARAVPTIGICFGHQAIAQALGGQVKPHGTKTQSGACSFRPTHNAEELLGITTNGDAVLLSHHNDIVAALPPHAESLGCGTVDPHPLCVYRTAPRRRPHILTMQSHPEFSTPTGRAVLRRIIRDGDQPKFGRVWGEARVRSIGTEGRLPIQLFQNAVSLLWPHT